MKVTLDTNVLVSATFWQGDSARVLDLIEAGQIELVLSDDILAEFAGVLQYDEIQDKVKSKKLTLKRTVEKVRSLASIVKPTQKLQVVVDDPDDNKILECAKAGKVSFIISQDAHLLKLKFFERMPIITPKDFLLQFK